MIPVNGSQVVKQILERSITDRVRSEIDNAVATVKTKIHDTILAAKDFLAILRVELAKNYVNASAGRVVDSFLLDSDQKPSQELPKAFKCPPQSG